MVTFPNAKINIGLHIIERRPDGYHNLESCFYPIGWEDVLEVIEARQTRFTSSGLPVPGNPDTNLCLQAYKLLQKDFDLPPVHIHLHKVIPVGAGLGGGSSDAAHTLKLVNELFDLSLSQATLEKYALALGSDCPFFILNRPVLAYGRGESFKPVRIRLKGKFLVLVNPAIHISTAEAFRALQPRKPEASLKTVLLKGPSQWRGKVRNDFEDSQFLKYPQIRDITLELYGAGALFAGMTGSGPTVFGIFDQETAVEHLFPGHYMVWEQMI